MRPTLIAILALACTGDDTGAGTDGVTITAATVTTDPAGSASSQADVAAVITEEAQGPAEVTYDYRWLSQSGGTWQTSVLPATATARGDTWTLTVTPYVGDRSGPPATASVDIVNTPPTLEAAAFDPEQPVIGTDLTCIPVNPSDADGDVLTLTYVWTIDGKSVAETSDTLSGSLFGVGVEVTCSITVNDGEADSETRTVSGSATNTAPTSTGSEITPASPLSTEDVTCTGLGGDDVDGDLVGWEYVWYIGGTEVTGETSATLAASFYGPDDVLNCLANPTDGIATGEGVISSNVIVRNTPPVATSAAISPAVPKAGDVISCVVDGTDPDGSTLEWTYAWTVNGTLDTSQASEFYIGDLVHLDTIQCTATASDGTDTASVDSTTVSVVNTVPGVPTVTLSPAAPTYFDAITCTASPLQDADDHAITYAYAWSVGTQVLAETSSTLGAETAGVIRDAVVECTATPTDSQGATGPAGSATVTVANAAPDMPSVTLGPPGATAESILQCNANPQSDVDGDAVTYTYAWFADGNPVSGGANGNLPAGTIVGNQVARCEATGSDGFLDSSPGSAELTITNAVPTVTTPTVTPTAPRAQADDLVCDFSIGADPDGGTPTADVTWEFENYQGVWVPWAVGVENSGAAGRTNDAINAADTVAGRSFRCTVRLTDAQGGVVTAGPSPARFVNSPPSCPADVYNNTTQAAGPYDAYGQCLYLGKSGAPCDRVCADAGLDNVSLEAHAAWPDSCGVPGGNPGEPSDWFYTHGNPALSTTAHNWVQGGLGYHFEGGVRVGKCINAGASDTGTFPGESTTYTDLSAVCACGEANWEPNVLNTGKTSFNSGRLFSQGFTVSETRYLSEVTSILTSSGGAGCSVEYWIHGAAGDITGAKTLLHHGSTPAVAGKSEYTMGINNVQMVPGTTYVATWASSCSVDIEFRNRSSWSSPSTSWSGLCFAAYSAPQDATFIPSGCTPSDGNAYYNNLRISP
jgi:hypothetical protein